MTINLTIERDHLLTAMQRVIGSVARRSTIAALEHVAFYPTDAGIRLLATNGDMQATTNCAASGSCEPFTLQGQVVLDILSNFGPGAQLSLTRDDKDPRVILKCGRSRFKLPTLSPDDLPVMDAPDGDAITLGAADLSSILDASTYAASKDQTRFVLTGVYMLTEGGQLKAVATNTHRLGVGWIETDQQATPAILAPAYVAEMMRILPDAGDVLLTIGNHKASFRVGDTELIGKVIDGEYLPWSRVIPNGGESLTVGRDALKAAINRALIMASDKDRSIMLDVASDVLTVETRKGGDGEAKNEIEAEWSGEPMRIALNGAYLLDALNHARNEEVVIEVAGVGKPVVIREDGRLMLVGVQRGI